MTNRPFLFALLFTGMLSAAQAVTPREQYAMDSREAANRYAEDRAICNDERNDGQRMKCLRTAKSENTRALDEAKARSGGQAGQDKGGCQDCARVTAVHVGEKKGESNALGLIGGGVVGGLLGNQVGAGNGRKLATVAGAVGGAYAGKKIQENANSTKVWTIDVEYDNGRRASFNFSKDPGMQRGDRVRNAGKSISRM